MNNKQKLTTEDIVAYEQVKWTDGLTPINETNLNKSDTALYNLLNKGNGYIFQLVDDVDSLEKSMQGFATEQFVRDEINKYMAPILSNNIEHNSY